MGSTPPSIWMFTTLGVAMTFFQSALSFYIITRYSVSSKLWRKMEYQLIMARVFIEALNGVTGVCYYCSIFPAIIFGSSFPVELPISLGLLATNLLEVRGFVAALISIERVLATTFPLKYYCYRPRISNIPVLLFSVAAGLACDAVLFTYCQYRFEHPVGCYSLICATPTCFQNYLFATKVIHGCTYFSFSIFLCIQLCWMSKMKKGNRVNGDFKKANWLSLTDGLSTVVFDIIPFAVLNSGMVNLQGMGPVLGSLRQTGRAVETAVTVFLIKQFVIVTQNVSVSSVKKRSSS